MGRILSPIVLDFSGWQIWIMLKWAIIFGIVAVIAGFLGFATLAGVAATIAKVLFWLFVAVTVILVIAGIFVAKKIF